MVSFGLIRATTDFEQALEASERGKQVFDDALRVSGSGVSASIMSLMPRIAFIGVLISCEVLARQLLFALLAKLARCMEASAWILALSIS